MTRQQMEEKLKSWNPHWNLETIKSWGDTQLKKIYNKESQKTIELIRRSLGLEN